MRPRQLHAPPSWQSRTLARSEHSRAGALQERVTCRCLQLFAGLQLADAGIASVQVDEDRSVLLATSSCRQRVNTGKGRGGSTRLRA